MENPEEVLQALDEFQKMRPSEIPRELEDYLCWVARTGDPVYQWSLVKALFREKLTRVMTEFYESCPSLDLTPCPNVEEFNYDIMKSNLLERLESFANAPFTVQRICELLTTPRKEYNRIDKFMRAIEKNILVVSTREPGPYGRRNENGDSMVNGSVEDETSHHGQTPNDVDMENWVKDCTATAAVPVHGDNEDLSVENGLSSPLKSTFGKHDRIAEHHLSAVDATASSFVTSPEDFSPVTNMPGAHLPVQDANTSIQNLTTVNHETAAIVGDVSDAIMNEDTSSQPSLELESDDNDSSDSKKLQTTFQAKDFSLDENKAPKTYSEALKSGKPEESVETAEGDKECDQSIQSTYSSNKLLDESPGDLPHSGETDNLDAHSIVSDEVDQVEKKLDVEQQISEKSEPESNICVDNFPPLNNNSEAKKDEVEETITDSSAASGEAKCDTNVQEEPKSESSEESSTNLTDLSENSAKESSEEAVAEAPIEVGKPIIEEPALEMTDSSDAAKAEGSELTIEETTDDDTKTTNTIVPDPIPIIEEPKDTELADKDWNSSVSVTEVSNESKEVEPSVKNGLDESSLKPDITEENQMVITSCEEMINKGATESMDVDNEGLLASAKDEPMEQDTTEAMNS